MFVDSHFHADGLFKYDTDFCKEQSNFLSLASVNSLSLFNETKAIFLSHSMPLISFGIHPQLPVMDEAENLAQLASQKRISAIGECGFDFYKNDAEKNKNSKLFKAQTEVFNIQLEIANKFCLPIIIHARRASDILFSYKNKLKKLPYVIIHSNPLPANEAMDFLRACPNCKFSFGLAMANKNKKSIACIKELPFSTILTETDAPFQSLHPNNNLTELGINAEDYSQNITIRRWSRCSDIKLILKIISVLRSVSTIDAEEQIQKNFLEVFPNAL